MSDDERNGINRSINAWMRSRTGRTVQPAIPRDWRLPTDQHRAKMILSGLRESEDPADHELADTLERRANPDMGQGPRNGAPQPKTPDINGAIRRAAGRLRDDDWN